MRIFKPSGRTLVTFRSSSLPDEFHVYLPSGGEPKNLAVILQAVAKKSNSPVGGVAADFISAIPQAVRCHLVPSARVSEYESASYSSYPADLRVFVNPGWNWNVCAYRLDGKPWNAATSAMLFSGRLADFGEWAKKGNGLEHTLKQVVKFTYSGGSSPGKSRLVRVEEVEQTVDGKLHICGYDLAKPDLKAAFRRYDVEKIVGEITVVSG